MFAETARAQLAACAKQPVTSWVPRQDALPLYVPARLFPARPDTLATAQAEMARVVADEGERLCQPHTKSEMHRLDDVQAQTDAIRCERFGALWRCQYDAQVICKLRGRQTVTREMCP